MFSLPFDYTREKLQSQGNKRRYSPTYKCFTNTAAVVFPSFFSFFLFFLSFFRVAASVQTGLALPLIVPPIRESFETKPTLPLQPMKVRAGELFSRHVYSLFALEHTYANTVAFLLFFLPFQVAKALSGQK